MLAWLRLGTTLLGVPSALFVYASSQHLAAAIGVVVAAGLGLSLLTMSVRRHRAAPDMLKIGIVPLATTQVLVTTACVLVLALSSLLLVL